MSENINTVNTSPMLHDLPWEISGAPFKPTKIGGISPCEGDAHLDEVPCRDK